MSVIQALTAYLNRAHELCQDTQHDDYGDHPWPDDFESDDESRRITRFKVTLTAAGIASQIIVVTFWMANCECHYYHAVLVYDPSSELWVDAIRCAVAASVTKDGMLTSQGFSDPVACLRASITEYLG